MLFDNLPLPLPWYPSVTLQDRFRQNVAMNEVITQLAPKDGILPFQLRKPSFSALPVTWKIKCAANGKLQDYIDGFEDPDVVDLSAFILTALEWTTLVEPGVGVFDYIIFKNGNNALDMITPDLPDGLPPGVYYMEMDFGDGTEEEPELGGKWCSETFRVPAFRFTWDIPAVDCKYPCFKWSHDSDISPLHYNSDDDELFYNLLYLDTWIAASEPEIDDTGIEDGFKEFHQTSRKLIVKYGISAMLPDYIKVALYMLLLHDNKYLFTEKSLREGEIKNVTVSSSIEPDGALSTVKILFEQMSLMVKTNCSIDMAEPLGESIPFDTPVVLSTAFCDDTGDVSATITGGPIPDGIYAELWGQVGAGAYTLAYIYISRAELLAGWSGNIGTATGMGHFKLKFRKFAFYVTEESTISVPVATC